MATQQYVAVGAAQLAMAAHTPGLQADGKWGTYTQQAFDRSPATTQSFVRDILRKIAGTSPENLYARRQAEKAKAAMTVVNRDDVRAVIRKVAAEEGVPADLALKVARLESNFDPRATSPTGAKGLFQMTGAALTDVKRLTGFTPTDIYDPEQNARAGIRYLKIAARYLGVRLDQYAEVYMSFNIGHRAAAKVLAGTPELAASQIKLQAYGAPAVYEKNVRAKIAQA